MLETAGCEVTGELQLVMLLSTHTYLFCSLKLSLQSSHSCLTVADQGLDALTLTLQIGHLRLAA